MSAKLQLRADMSAMHDHINEFKRLWKGGRGLPTHLRERFEAALSQPTDRLCQARTHGALIVVEPSAEQAGLLASLRAFRAPEAV